MNSKTLKIDCSEESSQKSSGNVDKMYSILKKTKAVGKFTHVSMGKRMGNYYLMASDDDAFFKYYSRIVSDKTPVCVAQKQDEYAPLIGDIDIKTEVQGDFVRKKGVRVLYSSEELYCVIGCFQKAITENVLGVTDASLICVVLEKKPYVTNPDNKGTRFLKNGFHLHFPYLYAQSEKIKRVLIPKIKEHVSAAKLNSTGKPLFSNHTDTPEQFVDDVTNKCWLMYGSSKSEEYKPYVVTEVWGKEGMKELTLEEAFCGGAFFTREETRLDVTQENVKELLPRLLDVSSIKKTVFNIRTPEDLKVPSKVHLKTKLRDIKEDSQDTICRNLTQAKQLLKMLAPRRADEYASWFDVGIILFNVGHGCDEAFNIWNKWSAVSDNYDEDACLGTWESMVKRDSHTKGMGSLRWLAKKDNTAAYTQFVEGNHGLGANVCLQDGAVEIMTTDSPLARMLFDLFSGEYVFTDAGWFHFNGTVWSCLKIDKIFRAKLEAIAKQYRQFKHKIMSTLYPEEDSGNDSNESNESEDEENDNKKLTKKTINILKNKLTELSRAINKLENFSSQNGILKMCEVLFYDEEFYNMLDQNTQLIGFKNGVFDFETMQFREGLQSDYISKTLNIKYKPDLSQAKRDNLTDFLQKIFPDESVRQYFVEQTCEVFRGGNRDKIAMFWTGTGNNGKSVTQKLFETMFGKKMAIKLSTSLITERIQPGSPNPQLTRLRGGVRWGVFDEIRKSEQIDCGSLKILTGGDSLPCRDLYQRGQDTDDFTPMFKFLCICNELPGLKDPDEATWDRIRIIPFESKFVAQEKCPTSKKEQEEKKIFLCDTEITLPKRMQELAVALGTYLIETFKHKELRRRVGTYKCIIPDKVNEAKIKYQTKCDIFSYFMEDTFIHTNNQNDKITFDSMFASFKAWYMESFSGKMISLNKKDFIDMVKLKYKLSETDTSLKGFVWNRKYEEEED